MDSSSWLTGPSTRFGAGIQIRFVLSVQRQPLADLLGAGRQLLLGGDPRGPVGCPDRLLEAAVRGVRRGQGVEDVGVAGGASVGRLADLCVAVGMTRAFAVPGEHERGVLGNAILARFPITSTSVVDSSHSRIERRGALAVQFNGENGIIPGNSNN